MLRDYIRNKELKELVNEFDEKIEQPQIFGEKIIVHKSLNPSNIHWEYK